jgi:PKD repeat protein
MGRGITAAAALAALAIGASAGPAGAATTRVVDQLAGPYTTIGDAVQAADPGDTVEIHPGRYDEQLFVTKDGLTLRATPGTASVESTGPNVVWIMARNVVLDGVGISGGPGGLHIGADGAVVRNASIITSGRLVEVVGAVHAQIDHALLFSGGLSGALVSAVNDDVGDQRLAIASSILTGRRMDTAIDVATGSTGDLSTRGGATVTLVHATVSGPPAAVRTARAGLGGPAAVIAYNSIVHGDAPALVADATDEVGGADAQTFRNAPALDFHLRADAAAIGRGGPLPEGVPHPATDFDGNPLRATGADAGALQFFNSAPSATFTASADTVRQGTPVTFDASASADPDAGGRITTYTWRFGSETVTTTGPVVRHVFTSTGTPSVGLTVTDNNGAQATAPDRAITVTDAIAPVVRIAYPRENARLHRLKTVRRHGKKRRVVNVLRFGGRATDAGGIDRVEITLRLLPRATKTTKKAPAPTTCTFYDPVRRRVGLRPCTDSVQLPAVRRGEAWTWRTSARLALPAGRWELTARATDRAGNATASVLHFTVT